MPVQVRQQQADVLKQAAVEQLGRLFGTGVLEPIKVILKDWAFEPKTATPLDAQPMYSHPAYGLPHALSHLWQGQLMFGSTEVAANFGGYLEGALEAAEMVCQRMSRLIKKEAPADSAGASFCNLLKQQGYREADA